MRSQLLAGAAAVALCPAAAMAVGLDRSGQPVGILFEDGNRFELSFSRLHPDVTGEDLAIDTPLGTLPGGAKTGNVVDTFSQVGAGLKLQITDRFSFAAIADEPYGSDVDYPSANTVLAPPPALVLDDDASNNLGGTFATVDSKALTLLGRYAVTENFSVHGGLRYTRLKASVGLSGLAYGGLNGYEVEFEDDAVLTGVIGVAYERPDIALRVALTYFEGSEHEHDTTEMLPAAIQAGLGLPAEVRSKTTIQAPDSVNLDFQTGLNPKTLLFGQIRYAWYEDVRVSPDVFDAAAEPTISGTSLTDIDDGYGVTLGIGRQLTDRLSGSVAIGYETDGDDDLVSPLAPSNGQRSIGIGLSYEASDQVTISGGIRYIALGDAFAETGTPDVARSDFSDNDVIGIGLRIGYSF